VTKHEAHSALIERTHPKSHARELGELFLFREYACCGMTTPAIVDHFAGRCTSIMEIMRGELRDIWGAVLVTEKIKGKKYCLYRLELDEAS